MQRVVDIIFEFSISVRAVECGVRQEAGTRHDKPPAELD